MSGDQPGATPTDLHDSLATGTGPDPAPAAPVSVRTPATFDLRGYRGVPLSTFRWRGWMVALIAAMLILPVIVIRTLVVTGVMGPVSNDVARALVSVSPYVFGVSAIWFLVRARHGRFTEAVGLRAFLLGTGVVAAVGGAAVARVLTAQITSWLVLIGLDPSGVDQFSVWGDSTAGLVAMAVIAVVVAPVSEELLFRGVLLTWLHDKWGPGVGVFVSSALFGASHADWLLLIPLTVVGIILARLYLSTRSLWIPIATHSLFNLSGVLLFLLLRATGTV